MEAGNVVPPIVATESYEKVPNKAVEKALKSNLHWDLPKENIGRLQKLFESLNLDGIGSWSEKQQQSVINLLMEYQHLFAMNLSELGKTSLVQHDIKLDNSTAFKEHYQRIPLHQQEEVEKHLQEMMEIGAICKSTSQWGSPIVLVCMKDGGL